MSASTFKYLCNLLRPFLKKEDTLLRQTILMECRVATTLYQLGSRNTLMMIGDFFGLELIPKGQMMFFEFWSRSHFLSLHPNFFIF